MAVNRIREIRPGPKILFPSQFDEAYGNRPEAYTGGPPPPQAITYPQITPAQKYHNEKMVAERNHIIATMKGRAVFERQTFREQRPGYVKTNPINNGSQPFFQNSGIMMPLPTYPGQLGSFHRPHAIHHKHLSGGVLTTKAGQQHARSILDRRAKQVRQMENPDVPVEPEILTSAEAQKIELSGLLSQIFDGVISGNFNDILYQEIRRCVILLLRTIPLIDDTEALNEIRIGFEDAYEQAEGASSNNEHHASLARPQQVLDVKAGYIARMLRQLFDYMNGIVAGNSADLSMRDRITLSRSVAKSVGLGSLTKGLAVAGLSQRREAADAAEAEAEAEGGEGGDDGGDEGPRRRGDEGGDEGPPGLLEGDADQFADVRRQGDEEGRNDPAFANAADDPAFREGRFNELAAEAFAPRGELREAPAGELAVAAAPQPPRPKKGLVRKASLSLDERIAGLNVKSPATIGLDEKSETYAAIKARNDARKSVALENKTEEGRLNRLAFEIGPRGFLSAYNKQKGAASPELVKILRDLKVRGVPKDDSKITRTKAKNRLEVAYPQLLAGTNYLEEY